MPRLRATRRRHRRHRVRRGRCAPRSRSSAARAGGRCRRSGSTSCAAISSATASWRNSPRRRSDSAESASRRTGFSSRLSQAPIGAPKPRFLRSRMSRRQHAGQRLLHHVLEAPVANLDPLGNARCQLAQARGRAAGRGIRATPPCSCGRSAAAGRPEAAWQRRRPACGSARRSTSPVRTPRSTHRGHRSQARATATRSPASGKTSRYDR